MNISEQIIAAFKPGERLGLTAICQRTGLAYPVVSVRMAGLVELGSVFRIAHGVYALERSDVPVAPTKKQQVLAAYKEHPACTSRYVRQVTKLPTQTVAMYTHHLLVAGLLARGRRGVYRAVEGVKTPPLDAFEGV